MHNLVFFSRLRVRACACARARARLRPPGERVERRLGVEENGDVLKHSFVMQEPTVSDEPILKLAENEHVARAAAFPEVLVGKPKEKHSVWFVERYPWGWL